MAPTSKTPSGPGGLRLVPSLPRSVAAPRARCDERLRVGRAMRITGELTADTDLSIEGTVTGRIDARNNRVIVGVHGSVASDVLASTVLVLGEVLGNIVASQKVEVSPSGTVRGNITAPRVVLADGATVQGGINRVSATLPAYRARPSSRPPQPGGGTLHRVPFWTIVPPGPKA